MGGCGGGGGRVKNRGSGSASPTQFRPAFLGASAWSRFCAFLRRNGTGLMPLMLAGWGAWRCCWDALATLVGRIVGAGGLPWSRGCIRRLFGVYLL